MRNHNKATDNDSKHLANARTLLANLEASRAGVAVTLYHTQIRDLRALLEWTLEVRK